MCIQGLIITSPCVCLYIEYIQSVVEELQAGGGGGGERARIDPIAAAEMAMANLDDDFTQIPLISQDYDSMLKCLWTSVG